MLRKKILKKKQSERNKNQRQLEEQRRLREIRERMKRINSAEFKEFRKQQYLKAHEHLKNLEIIEPRAGWMDGVGAKRSILDPVRLKNDDYEELNQRRRDAGILVPIEVAADDARASALAKAKNIGISYNKGGYVYLGSGKDVKDLGKKTSQVDFDADIVDKI